LVRDLERKEHEIFLYACALPLSLYAQIPITNFIFHVITLPSGLPLYTAD
jgi:hypothetical protein